MRLTDEMVREDDRRYGSYNVLAELIWCGREVYHRKSITNDNIRFQAWLCRAAADLLKKQQEKDQCLKGKCRICPHCDHCDVDENGHLKGREPEEPTKVLIEEVGPLYYRCFCKNCGNPVGNIVNGKVSVAHKKYCDECGTPVLWKAGEA